MSAPAPGAGRDAAGGAMDARPLRFGILCDGPSIQAYQARAVERLLALPGVELALVVINADPPRPPPRRGLKRFLRGKGMAFTLYHRAFLGARVESGRPVDMGPVFAGVPTLRVPVVRKGKFSEYFREEDVAAVRSHGLDFLLRCGFGIIRGEILSAARLGVWSFHHGDEEKYRGGPPCFWEIYRGEPVTGAILQRLTDRLDGGVVLQKGFFRTVGHSYARSLDAVKFGSADWPARVVADLRAGNAAYLEAPPSRSEAPIYRRPTDAQTLRFAAVVGRNWLRTQWRARFVRDRWGVGVIDAPIHRLLEGGPLPPVRWLRAPRGAAWIADPFAAESGGRQWVLAEAWDAAAGRGHIVALGLDGAEGEEPAEALREPFHMSYPCVVEDGDALFCVPETADAGRVTVYRADAFPHRWEAAATIECGARPVDPTLFRHEGRWWLFCTDREHDSHTKLFAWHAGALAGPWLPHAQNPLKTDVRSSRPAGTPFVHEGVLYRPAQDCSRTYGGAVVINRVLRLSPTEFAEEPAAVLSPDPDGPFPDGMHTVSAAGARTLVDGKREAPALPARLGSALARLRARLARPSRSAAAEPGFAPRRPAADAGAE